MLVLQLKPTNLREHIHAPGPRVMVTVHASVHKCGKWATPHVIACQFPEPQLYSAFSCLGPEATFCRHHCSRYQLSYIKLGITWPCTLKHLISTLWLLTCSHTTTNMATGWLCAECPLFIPPETSTFLFFFLTVSCCKPGLYGWSTGTTQRTQVPPPSLKYSCDSDAGEMSSDINPLLGEILGIITTW